jgi:co-chaperonin GroES (HSP10)
MFVRPLHDRILVQRLDEGEQQVGSVCALKPSSSFISLTR